MKNFNEKALVQKLDKILRKKFGTNLSFKEFSAGYGIADLVFAENFSFNSRKVRRLPVTNFYALKILFFLESSRVYTKDEILKLGTPIEKTSINKQLNFLVKNDYVDRVSKNAYRKKISETDLSPIRKVVAIEVKLTDYKNGLIQARRYQYFADESYLAILKDAEKHIDFDEFNKSNIGLILFDNTTNTIEIKYPQRLNNTEGGINLYAKELMFEKYLSLSF